MPSHAINPEMILLARESRGMTQGELAERLAVTQGKVSKYESGILEVSIEDLARIAKVLHYRESLFYEPQSVIGCTAQYDFFRKRQSIPMRQMRQIEAKANLLRIQVTCLLRYADLDVPLEFHRMDVGDYDGGPEEIARILRVKWRLPLGPVRNLVDSIERAGGIVVKCDFGIQKIDAVSSWLRDLPPLFFVNLQAPFDRLRFTLAHEIGHLVMHHIPTNDMEREADRFAAEFLTPAMEIRAELYDLSLTKFAAMKEYWRVSMAALIRRAHDLRKITDRQYKYYCMEMARRGMKTREPVQLQREEPSIIRKLIDLYRTYNGYTIAELSKMLHLTEEEFRKQFDVSWPDGTKQNAKNGLRIVG